MGKIFECPQPLVSEDVDLPESMGHKLLEVLSHKDALNKTLMVSAHKIWIISNQLNQY